MSWSQRAHAQASFENRMVSARRKRQRGMAASSARRRSVSLNLDLLEPRTLLSGQTVQLIKDINTVDSYPTEVTAAGSKLFYLVEDSTDSGEELEVSTVSAA